MNELKSQNHKLIVGLGNPGEEYGNTRHNVGFLVVDEFSKKYQIDLKYEKKLSSWYGKKKLAVNGNLYEIIVAKPDTYMNKSGVAVSKLLNWFKLEPLDMIIIHDEVALDLGKIRISFGRSSGGHHGIESIIESIGGTKDFARIRLGVGPDPGGDVRANYVLGKFTSEDTKLLKKVVDLSVEAIETLLVKGEEYSMNKYNGMTV